MNKLLSVFLLAFVVWAAPAAAEFEENVNYIAIQPEPEQGKPGDKIEVIEFFMYGCPHCYHFDPTIKAWEKTKAPDVEFVRIPAMFGRHFNLHAQAYYALEAMGESERLHDAFFAEIHERKNPMKTREAVEAFVQGQGVDLEKFREAMSSFAVAAKTNRAAALLRRYSIRSVPSLVIDGRYRSGRGLSFKDMTRLADFLVAKVREDRKGE